VKSFWSSIVCAALVLACIAAPAHFASAQTAPRAVAGPQKVIIDTDIGDDIDDAFAVALALSSHRVQILGITTAWGDTDLRARLAERLLTATGHTAIPVSAGPETKPTNTFTQRLWASHFPQRHWGSAVSFIASEIHRYPGQITLICIAPLSNVGALIQKDPAAFHQLRRVVMMGGSIYRGYGDLGFLPSHGPSPEYNIRTDIPAAKELFASGVPIYLMPLDSTQLKLNEVLRAKLFSRDTRATNALTELYEEWTNATQNPTPTLYDAMAVADVLKPSLCPTTPLHIAVDDQGYTRVEPGPPNANVCLRSNSTRFFHFYFHTLLGEAPSH
jgi:inosine-uridine nucleoside N-ribohydrolase